MSPTVEHVTQILSLATLFIQIIICISVIIFIFSFFNKLPKTLYKIKEKTSDHIILIGLVVSSIGLFISLLYSNLFGFEPCELCWWQRIFLYPQVIIFGIAFYNKVVNKIEDNMAFFYTLVLSICGGCIALFQYYGQMFNPNILSTCASQSISCSKIIFIYFGYITMPLMSLTTFITLSSLFFLKHRSRSDIS